MQSRLKTATYALAVGLLAAPGAASIESTARPTRICLGTLAPRGSMYHQVLQDMGESWKELSDGTVKLKIFPGGGLGGEADMVGLMRIDSLQAGLLTGVGLSDVEPGVAGLQSVPMMFRSLEEVDHVMRELGPTMEERLRQKGFVVLFWTDAAWVRLFTKQKTLTPKALERRKLFAWSGNPDQIRIMSRAGYRPISLETGDIVASLKTGMIDAVHAPPIYALASQFDRSAPHMLELNWAPLIGALVITTEAWERVPEEHRKALGQAAAEAGQRIKAMSRKESDKAVATMRVRGLNVHSVSPELEAEWRAAAEKVYPQIRGSMVPEDVFDAVEGLLSAYRAQRVDAVSTFADGESE
jgi:TRAP-type C4-dicarboxylate transport system substrate-binding protein